jgi:gliding motility-associated-like protein
MSFISNDTLLCIGETACLDAYPQLMPTTWAALPSADLGGATYLPDDVGSCFESGLDFGIFTPGQTLNNINDLTSICVNMEHSFMGDFVASIICPNGQSVILHQQNGGGTYLGDPFDVDDSLQPGNCWQYCWSPIATNGTWEDNAEFGATPNVMVAPNTGSNSLIPGTYESLNPLNGLVGCPLNGTWTLEFCDLWGSDDGFICDWEIAFDPSIYPPLTTFTPIVGNDSDSSYWSATGQANTFISSSSTDLNQICLTPTQTGTFDYDYTIVDNHGCTYDTTIVLTVGNGATIDAGQDQTICPGDFQVDALTTGGIDPAPTCDYTINMFDTFADGWNGFSIDVFINGTLQDNHTLANGGTASSTFPVADGDAIVFNVIAGTFDSEVSYEIVDCSGNVLFQAGANYSGAAPMTGNNIWVATGVSNALPQYSYSWTPTPGVTTPSQEDPLINTQVTQTYTVEVWETTHPNCINSDDITLTVVNNGYAGNDTVLYYCQDAPVVDLFTEIPNNPDAGGVWYVTNNSNPTTSTFDPSNTGSTDFIYVVGTGGCSDTSEIIVNVAAPFLLNLTTDTIICENGTATISVNPSGGLGGPYEESWDQAIVGNGPHNIQPGVQTMYNVFVTDNYGCVSQTEQVTVNYNPPILIALTNTDSICIDDIANLSVVAQGGDNNYNYTWTSTGSFVSSDAQVDVSPVISTEYCVEVSDGCETTPVQNCVDVELFPMPTLSFESDIINGCYPIDVTFTNTSNSGLIQDIEWVFGDGNTASGAGPISNTYSDPTCHTVTINVTTVNACAISLTQTDMICPDDYPLSDFVFDPNITDLNQTTVEFEESASSDAVSFNWDFGDNSEVAPSSENNPTVVFPVTNPNNYEITLTVTNAAGCSHDTTYTLIINDVFSLYVPNSFSPNGDGVNDYFFPKGAAIDAEGYEMLIFDRDGHIIFETTQITDYWNGTAKTGEHIPQGVYVWKITAIDQYTGEDKQFMGHVNLIR